MPFGGDQPAGIGAIALRYSVRIVREEKIRISAGKCSRGESLTRGSRPLAMPLLLFLVRAIDEGGEDLDHHVVAAEAKGCCLRRYARGGALKLVGDEGALRGRGGIHRLDKDIDVGVVDSDELSYTALLPGSSKQPSATRTQA